MKKQLLLTKEKIQLLDDECMIIQLYGSDVYLKIKNYQNTGRARLVAFEIPTDLELTDCSMECAGERLAADEMVVRRQYYDVLVLYGIVRKAHRFAKVGNLPICRVNYLRVVLNRNPLNHG